MKFVMCPTGVGFFPEHIPHNMFYVLGTDGLQVKAIAAGFVYATLPGSALDSLLLDGQSIGLGINAKTAYSDWKERGGAKIERKYYEFFRCHVYFLPFAEVERYGAMGVGKPSESEPATFEQLVESIKTERR